jgi:purine-nucleoside phosphorylase
MSVHISAAAGSIANIVLMPGDPLRAKFMAEKYLSNSVLVSSTRNVFYFTGEYKGKTITIGASGMGCPSIGIYSYELYTEYKVDTIIRIGTCGGYSSDLNLYDIVNVRNAASESTFAKFAWEIDDELISSQGKAFDIIQQTAAQKGMNQVKSVNIHSSDIFYRKNKEVPEIAQKYNCPAVEMEAFALFANAKYLGKSAATILTVSDIIPTHEYISADEREKSLLPMMELALDATLSMD